MTKDFVAINLNNSNSYTPNAKFFCSLCNCKLCPLNNEFFCSLCNCKLCPLNNDKEEYVCTRCNISYFPKGEKVKRANKFATPGPLTDEHGNITGDKTMIVSMVEEPSMIRLKKAVFPRSLESLKRPGVNITSLSSTVDNEGI
jgi:hypothetical protein